MKVTNIALGVLALSVPLGALALRLAEDIPPKLLPQTVQPAPIDIAKTEAIPTEITQVEVLVDPADEPIAKPVDPAALAESTELARQLPVDPAARLKLETQAIAGRSLFEREWKPVTPAVPGNGDGLGPHYNDVSCVGCHHQGGVGGAGPASKNVLFRRQRGIGQMIHRFGPEGHDAWRNQMLQPDPPPGSRQVVAVDANITFTERNTPALFGMGLIDAIPNRVLLEIEQRSKQLFPARETMLASGSKFRMAAGGRLNRMADRRFLGRFGWKGQTATLAEFTAEACAGELGLGMFGPDGDMTLEQQAELVAYIRLAPRPVELTPASQDHSEIVGRGLARFTEIGCADCHLPKVGDVAGIYSDLLLHDMGEGLSGFSMRSSYGGGGAGRCKGCGEGQGLEPQVASATEWRTPPLWGCRDSAPYLHDGRAKTLQDAILLHGGQGQASADRFRALPRHEQLEVVWFLETLVAPTPVDAPPAPPAEAPRVHHNPHDVVSGR